MIIYGTPILCQALCSAPGLYPRTEQTRLLPGTYYLEGTELQGKAICDFPQKFFVSFFFFFSLSDPLYSTFPTIILKFDSSFVACSQRHSLAPHLRHA